MKVLCLELLCPFFWTFYPISTTFHRTLGAPQGSKTLVFPSSGLLPHLPSLLIPDLVSLSPVTCPIGTLELPTPLIAAHQLYNYVADHASSYHMKPLRMARPGGPEHNEYALVSAWHR